MKIVRVPEGFPQEDMQKLSDKFKEDNPNELVIFISDVMDIINLSLEDLYKLRDMIDKEISTHELMVPDERK